MVNQQPGKSRTENEPDTEHETVNLTVEELRSVSGGNHVYLNLEIDRHTSKEGHPPPPSPHDRKR
jgi:hypothetical protein